MARSGSGVYSKPAGTTAVASTTIESAKFNTLVDDIVDDLNAARPIVAGGTGATSASAARDNLGTSSKVLSKSSSYTAVAGDRSKVIRCTATMTLSLTAAATLGDGWFAHVIADGGTVTVDPDGSETIDGSATLALADGGSAIVHCDGTGFYTVGAGSAFATITVAGAADLDGTLNVSGAVTLQGDLGVSGNITLDGALSGAGVATAAQYRADTAGKVLTTDKVWDAAEYVTLTDAATIALDLSTGLNFQVTLAGNRTLGAPSSLKPGQSGIIKVIQDGTGSRTLDTSNFVRPNGVGPTLSTAAGAYDLLHYAVLPDSTVLIQMLARAVS